MYSPYILAQVDVESDFDGALRNGFEILTHYIFRGNKKRESISMTAPVSEEKVLDSEEIPMMAPVTSEKISMTASVTEERAGLRAYRVSFALPSSSRSKRSLSHKTRGSRLSSLRAAEKSRYDCQGVCTGSSQLRRPRNSSRGYQGTGLHQNQSLLSLSKTRNICRVEGVLVQKTQVPSTPNAFFYLSF
jgi:hypothetical protein